MAGTQTPTIHGDASRFKGCSSIRDYDVLGKLGEGTFGEVHRARSSKTGAIVALKKILMHSEKDGFPITALREIKIMKLLSHPNILRLEDMAMERPLSKGKEKPKAIIYMVSPYMDHDLSGLLENPSVNFTEAQIKCYMLQLLKGVQFLHNSHILHRDMKAANLLINNQGLLQIADFGLARHYDEPVPRPGRGGGEARRDYTSLVVTRWYRPPELLLQLRKYTTAIDMWGVGCVFGEMFKRHPILMGKSDLNQIQQIFDLVGSPNDENMPGWNELPGCEGTKQFNSRPGRLTTEFREIGSGAIELLAELLKLDWRKRITAVDALEHPYFKTSPLPARREELPRYEDSHELDRRKFRDQKANGPPPAPAGGTVGMGPHGEWAAGPSDRGRGGYEGRGGFGRPPRDHDARYNGPPSAAGHHDRRPPQSDPRGPDRPLDRGPPDRRPGWERPPARDTAPRPVRPGEPVSNGRPPAARPPVKDTYIPSYSAASDAPQRREDRDERPPRRDDREWDYRRDDRRHERHRDYREREYPPRDRDRDRDRDRERDWNRPPRDDSRPASSEPGWQASGQSNGSRHAAMPRRNRSRSPSKGASDRGRVEDKDKEREMLYRR